MFKVNIYIETSTKGLAKRKAAGMYVLEFIRENGVPETRNGVLFMESTTENEMVLELLLLALKRIIKSCSIVVFTTNHHVFNVMKYHWLPQWEKNGWKNAKGKTTKNMLLWQQIKENMDIHTVTLSEEEHSYSKVYMKRIIEEELKREHTESVERRKDV